MGCIGLPYDEFCALEPDEFGHVYRAWAELQESLYKDGWERMRTLAYVCIQPYASKGLTPHGLLPLPWDKDTPRRGTPRPQAAIPGRKEAMERLKEVMRKTRDG